MSYNFYFISGRNPASTIQALQQAPKAQPEPRPRPVLQLVDQTSPEIAPLTEANVQARTPDPRPRNRDILRQRAETIRDDASIRAPSTRRSRSYRSRSPGRQSTQVIGQIDFSLSPPNMDVPPGQWSQNIQGIWNQYGESTTLLPPVVTDPHCYLSSSSSITHAFPSEGPRSTLLESPASPLSNNPIEMDTADLELQDLAVATEEVEPYVLTWPTGAPEDGDAECSVLALRNDLEDSFLRGFRVYGLGFRV